MKTTERIRAKLLNIGAVSGMGDLKLLRLHMVNGFVLLGISATVLYVAIFTAMGISNSLTGFLIIPILTCALYLNHINCHTAARVVAIYVTLILVFVIALTERRTGTEHLLLVMGLTSLVIFERYWSMITAFTTACVLYFLYLHLDQRLAFEAVSGTPYSLVNKAILLLCGIWITSLLFISVIPPFDSRRN